MIRTQIQLEEAQFNLIRSEAAKKNISVAGLVREALARYLKSPRQVALRNLATLRPAFKPIPMDDLSDHDRWFAEAVMDSKRRSD